MSQNENLLKVLKIAHANLLEWFEMSCIGIYSGLFGITCFFRDLEAQEIILLSTSGG